MGTGGGEGPCQVAKAGGRLRTIHGLTLRQLPLDLNRIQFIIEV